LVSNGRAHAQSTTPHPLITQSEYARWQTELSNWGRWGKDDELGTLNLITPAKRKAAVGLVREGMSFSCARNAEIKEAVDNPAPILRKTTRTGASVAHTGIASTSDTFFISYHGMAHTHMDSLCHFVYDGKMYNGYSQDEVTEEGANKNSVLNFKNGIMTRGVLMDMARYKGVDWLEPGMPIYPEDLEGWEKKAGVKVQSGDVMMIRTGRWARRDAQGAWPVQQLAGLHMSCAPWMHARDVAILGGDDAQDVLPSRVEGVSQPIHALCIVAMGMPIFDNLDLELLGREAEKRKRWEFLVTASPAAVPGATGSVLNPIATF
ncbi:MAG TPA: cyclase family protein, partial [Rhizomicrobium sp.]|nr:cyclase family protein [Rhizomicrobium sp.]